MPINYKILSESSALRRFNENYPNLEIEDIKTVRIGKKLYETDITIKKQTITYAESWH